METEVGDVLVAVVRDAERQVHARLHGELLADPSGRVAAAKGSIGCPAWYGYCWSEEKMRLPRSAKLSKKRTSHFFDLGCDL